MRELTICQDSNGEGGVDGGGGGCSCGGGDDGGGVCWGCG